MKKNNHGGVAARTGEIRVAESCSKACRILECAGGDRIEINSREQTRTTWNGFNWFGMQTRGWLS